MARLVTNLFAIRPSHTHTLYTINSIVWCFGIVLFVVFVDKLMILRYDVDGVANENQINARIMRTTTYLWRAIGYWFRGYLILCVFCCGLES